MLYFPPIGIKYPHEFINKGFIAHSKPLINIEGKDVLCNGINRIDIGVINGIKGSSF